MSDPTKVSRRLVAVFAADVEGYSRLMDADVGACLERLRMRLARFLRMVSFHGDSRCSAQSASAEVRGHGFRRANSQLKVMPPLIATV
jgi:hypothetical protein